MLKKKLYRLHRSISVLIGIPVFLWAISGLLHPIMTNIRPEIATQSAPRVGMDSTILQKALKPTLSAHGIDTFYLARKIFMAGTWYEQVRLSPVSRSIYFNAKDGRLLNNGDQQYAAFLAQHFMSGNDQGNAKVRTVRYLTSFTTDYPSVNRILPVYQVEFDRPDDLSIFVSTALSQFSYAKDNNRTAFNWFFGFFHTWSWLDQFPGWKAGIMAFILLLTLATAGMGLYIAFTTKARLRKGNRLTSARRWHRLTALVAAFFTLAWVFSGMIHSIQNSLPDESGLLLNPQRFNSLQLPANPANLVDSLSKTALKQTESPLQVSDIQYLTIDSAPFMRVRYQNKQKEARKSDLMQDQKVQASRLLYFNLKTHKLIKKGDRAYAIFLAKSFFQDKSPMNKKQAFNWENAKVSYQTKFDMDYNFSDKILPVWKVSPDGQLRHTVFIHTESRTLTKRPSVFGRVDSFSFGFFHKHEFMAWAGKSVKDLSTIIGVLLVLCMLLFGYRLYFLSRKRKKKNG